MLSLGLGLVTFEARGSRTVLWIKTAGRIPGSTDLDAKREKKVGRRFAPALSFLRHLRLGGAEGQAAI